MTTIIIAIFLIGYAAVAFENVIKINKTATALLLGMFCWTVYIIYAKDVAEANHIKEQMAHHFTEIAEILFFLIAAMTIVELVDAHEGFNVITKRITTQKAQNLLWVIVFITFFMSAVLDNLTTAIVMVSLLRKLVSDREKRLIYACVVIIAANAGGAWSPIGDVSTTLLWTKGQVSTLTLMLTTFLPSLVSVLIPTIYFSFQMKGDLPKKKMLLQEEESSSSSFEGLLMFCMGVGTLVFIPIFKTLTGYQPYVGAMLGLGIIWAVSERLHYNKRDEDRRMLSVAHALTKVDTVSVLFFMGILLSIACLEATGILESFAGFINSKVSDLDIVVVSVGLISAIIDNASLVKAMQGMYPLAAHPIDSKMWEFLAYCAGTGGSIFIIGSAAGVAVMGMEKVESGWFLKKISLITLVGYLAGAATYLLIYSLLNG